MKYTLVIGCLAACNDCNDTTYSSGSEFMEFFFESWNVVWRRSTGRQGLDRVMPRQLGIRTYTIVSETQETSQPWTGPSTHSCLVRLGGNTASTAWPSSTIGRGWASWDGCQNARWAPKDHPKDTKDNTGGGISVSALGSRYGTGDSDDGGCWDRSRAVYIPRYSYSSHVGEPHRQVQHDHHVDAEADYPNVKPQPATAAPTA